MSQDVFGTAMGIGGGADLNAYTAPGLYYQPANVQAQSGKNYPETVAGSLQIYKHAGITQIYRVYSNSRSYIRTLYNGVWSAWTKQYDAANKPSADDVDAVSAVNGGTFRKLVSFNEGLEVRSRTGIVSGNDAASFDSANMILKSWYGIGFYSTLLDSVGKETGMTGYINTRNGLLQMKGQIIPGIMVILIVDLLGWLGVKIYREFCVVLPNINQRQLIVTVLFTETMALSGEMMVPIYI